MVIMAKETSQNQYELKMTGVTQGQIHTFHHALAVYAPHSVSAHDLLCSIEKTMCQLNIKGILSNEEVIELVKERI